MKHYTIREAAAALGVTKPTAARYARMLPEAEIMQDSYRGQPRILVSEAGLNRIRTIMGEAQAQSEAQNQAEKSASSEKLSASSEKNRKDTTEELIALLQSQLAAKDRQILDLAAALERAQESLTSAQALHAATAAELRRLTAAQDTQPDPPETPLEKPEREEEPNTPPSTDNAQENNRLQREDQTDRTQGEEPPPTLLQRLRFLFTGQLR